MRSSRLAWFFCALLVGAALVSPAAARAQDSARVAQWRTFFAVVLPTVDSNFASIRGGKESGHINDNYYSVTASLDPALVTHCSINSNVYWSLFCSDIPPYVGSASLTALAADIRAALPSSFDQEKDTDGQPKWVQGHTDIFLVAPTSETDDWAISVGNNV